jgi:tetratricopeptide (TPR) repeat protein
VARGTQHRKRRPRTHARVASAPVKPARRRRASWEDQLFFGRLRSHARWMFVLLAAAFAISFIILGVGSGSTGISQVLGNFFNGTSATGASLSSLQQQTTLHPKSATAWLNYANKLEQKHQDDNAIAALQSYSKLRPKDQNALLELAGLELSRANDWDTLYIASQTLTEVLNPTPVLSPKASSPLGKALASLPTPFASAVSSQFSTATANEYEKVLTYLTSRVSVYQKLTKLDPGNAVNQYSLAQAAQEAGNSKVAISAYRTFVKLAPDDSLAPTARQQIAALKSSGG